MYRGKLIQIRREIDDLYIIRIRKSGSYFLANKTSAYILKLADQGVPINRIPSILKCEFNISLETGKIYLQSLINHIKNMQSFPLNIDLKSPLRASWKLTSKCNLKCKHCYSSCSPICNNEFSHSEILQIIEKLDRAEVFDISVTGGEIFTLSQIKNILTELVSRKFDVSVFSNATLILENKDWLFKLPIRKYNISLDGLENSHDFIRGKGNFQKVWTCIKELKQNGNFVLVNCVINSINVKELDEIHDLLFNNNIEYQFTLMLPLGRGNENIDLLPQSQDYIDGINKLQKKLLANREKGTLVHAIDKKIIEVYADGKIKKVDDNWTCNAGNTKIDINWNGDVYSCPMCEESCLGNILNSNLCELWANEQRIKFIKEKKRPAGHFCIPVRDTISRNEVARQKMEEFLGCNLKSLE